MKRSIVILVGVAIGIVGATSIELPICTAPGDQFYPDVCWDGEAFWVVWQDEELGTIRGIRVNDKGEFLTDEVELLPKANDGSGVRHPCVAAGGGRIGAECRVKIGYTEFGEEAWGVGHNEFDLRGTPLHQPHLLPAWDYDDTWVSTPSLVFGKMHFFSIHMRSFQTPIDFHGSTMAWGLDSALSFVEMLWKASNPEVEYEPPVACWDGSRFVVVYRSLYGYENKGAFLVDSLISQGIGESFTIGRSEFIPNLEHTSPKYQSLVSINPRYFLISEARVDWTYGFMGFDILDSTCTPIKDSATFIDFNPDIQCCYPDAASNGKDFVAVWENRFQDSTVHLYAIKVDTLRNTLKSGYVVWEGPVNQQPALAYGGGKYLLVWSDNRGGDFNVYGTFQDAVGVEEQNPLLTVLPTIIAQPSVFTTSTTLYLPDLNMDKDLTLKIYDNTGSLVKRLVLPKGERSVVWDGNDEKGKALHSGVYFVRGIRDGMIRTTKAVIVR